jgi:hypothetical protein
MSLLLLGAGMSASSGPTSEITATILAAPLNQVFATIATLDAPAMAGTPVWEIVSGGSLFALGS